MVNNKPLLRFNGFKDSWEFKKLGDVGTSFSGLNGKNKNDFGHGEARYVTYMNVFSNTLSLASMLDKIEIDNNQQSVKYGDVFFTISSETPEEVAMSSVWLHNLENIYLNSFCFGFRPTIDIKHMFLAYSLRSKTFRNKVKILAQGISRYNISKTKILEIMLPLPSLPEQTKIGNLFRNIDTLIEKEEIKYNKLLDIKKSLSNKMFPIENTYIPSIRFNGYCDNWDIKKSSDLFVSITDKGYTELPILSATQERGMMKREDLNLKIFHDINNESGYKRVLPGQFVIHLSSFQSGFAHSNVEGITSPAYNVLSFLKVKEHYDIFWKYVLKSKEFIQRLKSITYGIRMGKSINFEDFMQMKFIFPSIDEQQKIGKLHLTVDTLLELYTSKINKLKIIKQSLLKRMFV